jgi:hypothetical protein
MKIKNQRIIKLSFLTWKIKMKNKISFTKFLQYIIKSRNYLFSLKLFLDKLNKEISNSLFINMIKFALIVNL